MNDNEIFAYCAGVLDGDGSIMVRRARPGIKSYMPLVTVTQLERDALELFQRRFGGTVVVERITTSNRKLNRWVVAGRPAFKCIEALLPFLVLKNERARHCLKLKALLESSYYKSEDTLNKMEELFVSHKSLNAAACHIPVVVTFNNELLLAYLAGIIDTDGSIQIFQQKGKQRQPSVRVQQSEFQALELLKQQFGGSIVSVKTKHRPQRVWSVSCLKAKNCLNQLLPYLRCKKNQAEICLAPLTAESVSLLKKLHS